MRYDWAIFVAMILSAGFPCFEVWLCIERHLPANAILFLGQNGYIAWTLVTIPAALAAFWAWQIYAKLMYGFWSVRLIFALCALLPTVIMNDKKIATALEVAPGAVDILALAVIGLFVFAVAHPALARFLRR